MKFLIIILTFLILNINGFCEVPKKINFQGRIEENGQPITGTKNMVFKIYDAKTGGNLIWESQQYSVEITNGLFSVMLETGTIVNISTAVFSGPAYVEITVNGTILLPRQEIVSTPYALIAQSLGDTGCANNQVLKWNNTNKHWICSDITTGSGTGDNLGNHIATTTIQANYGINVSSLSITGEGITNSEDILFQVAGTTFIILNNGRVGIGTLYPDPYNDSLQKLTVGGVGLFDWGINIGTNSSVIGGRILNISEGGIVFNGDPGEPAIISNNTSIYHLQNSSKTVIIIPYFTPEWKFNISTGTENSQSLISVSATGNLGIKNFDPPYRLTVSSGPGESGPIVVITTGTSEVIKMTGAGEIYANKFIGSGSQLSGITASNISNGNYFNDVKVSSAIYADNAGSFDTTKNISLSGSLTLNTSSLTIISAETNNYSLLVSTSIQKPHLYISTNGNVGINTNIPNSTLHIHGSFATQIISLLSSENPSYTLTEKDNIIICNPDNPTTLEIYLPSAVGMRGRQYTIKNAATGETTVAINSSGSETIDGGGSILLGPMESVTLISDGSNWLILNWYY